MDGRYTLETVSSNYLCQRKVTYMDSFDSDSLQYRFATLDESLLIPLPTWAIFSCHLVGLYPKFNHMVKT